MYTTFPLKRKTIYLDLLFLYGFQKGAYYSAIQIYKLPDYIKLLCIEHKCSCFKNYLKKFLLTHTFYNMDEFYSLVII